MIELIDHIPFVDVIIVGLVALFVYVGWKHGLVRLLMTIGSLYTGFLLSSIYYHKFGTTLARALNTRSNFTTDYVGFIVLQVAVTLLMVIFMFTLFGHIRITGQWAILGRLGGSVTGLLTGVLIAALAVTLLRTPYESNKNKLDPNSGMAPVEVFNQNYAKSAIAPILLKSAPYLLQSVQPMLPPEARAKGAAPIMEAYAPKHAQ